MRKPGQPRHFNNKRSLIGVAPATLAQVDAYVAQVEALDIETDGLIGEFLGGALTRGESLRLYRDLASLVRDALSTPIVIAHNGSGFDFPRLIGEFFRLELQHEYSAKTYFSGNRMIAIAFTRHDEKKACSLWLDTYAQVPTTLDRFSKAFAPDLAKLSGTVNFDAGGRWSWDNPAHVEYLRRDVLSLKRAYVNFVYEMYRSFGILVKMSAAGNAMRAFRTSLLWREKREGHFYTYWRLSKRPDSIAQAACYGGWVFPGTECRQYENTVKLDVRAAYGAVMRDADLPRGCPCYTREYVSGHCGCYRVLVHAPASERIAAVPYRHADGHLYYLGGGYTAETTLIAETLEYLRSVGYEIQILEGIYWRKSDQIFRPFMEQCEALERQGGARKDVAKLVRNGLSGRLRLRPLAKRLLIADEPPAGAVPLILPGGRLSEHVYETTELIDDASMQPHLYAYITGLHRLRMLKLAHRLGPERFLYCDTDSIEAPAGTELLDCFYQGDVKDAQYGDILLEARHARFISYGPKQTYSENEDGTLDARLKGVPRRLLTPEFIYSRLFGERDAGEFVFDSPHNARVQLRAAGQAPHGLQRTRAVAWNASHAWDIIDGHFIAKRPTPLTPERVSGTL